VLLYDSAVSGNCYKVRLLLAQLGIEYERRELDVVDRSNRESVIGRERNPALRVPTLVLDDGRALGESNAILWWLAGDTDFAPDDKFECSQVLQWQFFEQYDHEPNIAVARFWLTKRLGEVNPERIEGWHAGGYRALTAMESHLASRTFLVGERYSIADISLYAYTHVAAEGGFDLGRYPAISRWLERVAAQPGHVGIDA